MNSTGTDLSPPAILLTSCQPSRSMIQPDDHSMQSDEDQSSSTRLDPAQVSSSANFKANLERFKHTEDESRSHQPTDKASTRRTSKRLREVDIDTKNNSPSPPKRRKESSRYAPPEKYAHLKPLTDVLEPGLICVFVGFNPGVRTATSGHAYAHPSNMFWKLLHSSGCTDVRLEPRQDVDLPRLYSMGNTNIVARPSRDAAELSKAESAAGTPILEEKIRKYRPEAVCIVGKGIWESIWRWRYGRNIKKDEFRYGWQDERERMGKNDDWEGAKVFVATATSGLAASLKLHEKEAIWKPFGEWVKERRKARSLNLDIQDRPKTIAI